MTQTKIKSISLFSGVGEASLAVFDVNAICDAIKRAGDMITIAEAVIESAGGKNSSAFKEGLIEEINSERGHDYIISEHGMARFLARHLTGHTWAQKCSNYYHLGDTRNRHLFFGINPAKSFYSIHKTPDTVVVLGSNDAEVPDNWTGVAVPFSELVCVNSKTGDLLIAPDVLERIIPSPKVDKPKIRAARIIHERRDGYLQMLAEKFTAPFDASDFHEGKFRAKAARDWFVTNIPGSPKNERTYRRDLAEFREPAKGKLKYDKTEKAIVLLLEQLAKPNLETSRRLAIAKEIMNVCLSLRKKETETGAPAEMPSGAFQRNTKGERTVEAVSDPSGEAFVDEVDRRISAA